MRNPSCFEDILDDCITAIQEQGKTVADCLARYPAQREELEPLLRLTVRLQGVRTLEAPPEFRRVAAARMRNLVATRPHRVERAVIKPNLLRHIRPRLPSFGMQKRFPVAIMISIVIAASLLVGGTVYASTDTLPGDVLYPVKRAVEAVQLAVSLSDAGDARLHLAFAARRLDEVAALLEKNRPQDIRRALADYKVQSESVLAFFSEDSNLSPAEQAALADLLVTAQAHHEARFTALLDQVPEAVRPTIESALTASRTGRDRVLKTVGEKSGREMPQPSPTSIQTATPTPSPELPMPTPSPEPPTPTPSPKLPMATPSPESPIPTPSPEPPTPTPSPEPPAPTPSPTPSEWPMPPGWPSGCPPPSEWPPSEWPPECPPPSEWPTPPEWPPGWPTPAEPPEWPTPPELPELPDLPDLPEPPERPDRPEPPGWP